MNWRIVFLCLAIFFIGVSNAAPRRIICLSGEGWTCDGLSVSVPHTWNAADGTDGPNGGQPPKAWPSDSAASLSYCRKRAVYRRDLPDPTPGRRTFVKCEGASVCAEVYVNGLRIGTHTGAFTAFTCEATTALRETGNVLEIEVDNRYDEQQQPMSADFTVYGGLYRNVWMIETDPVCIDLVTDGADGVTIHADAQTGDVEAHVAVLGGTNEVQRFRIADPVPWSPENPKVYERTIRIEQDGSSDEISVTFGFRTVEFKADGFYLNGEKLVLRGVNRHQDREGKGWAVSSADEEDDMDQIRGIGANALRTAHYPQSRHIYDLCDRKGIVCWVEYPNVNRVTCTETFERGLFREYREMIAQLRNHPSVCMWGLYNEMHGSGNDQSREKTAAILTRLNDFVHRTDPSRPTVAATDKFKFPELNGLPDQLAFNRYPGWYDERPMRALLDECFEKTGRGILGMSEYGVGGSVNQHGEPTAAVAPHGSWHPEEYQAFRMHDNLLQLAAEPRMWGSFVWAMFDFGADRRTEGDRHGINDKGLIAYDHRTRKDTYYLYRANWCRDPVLHLVGSRLKATTNSTISVMGISNVGDVSLAVNDVLFGSQAPDRAKMVLWRDVPLRPGDNKVELSAAGMTARAVWRRDEAVKR